MSPADFHAYDEFRNDVRDGDILLVSGKSPISLIIRALTFSKMSHVAVFIWLEGGLWVYEAKEFQGIRFTPASLYIKDRLDANQNIYFGRAPECIHREAQKIRDKAFSFRNAKYGYSALPVVLAAQIVVRYFKKVKIDSRHVVCSILVQRIWETCGHVFPRLMSPGMFVDECQFTTKIRAMSAGLSQ